jgi:outer membrane protein assembly factor BamB
MTGRGVAVLALVLALLGCTGGGDPRGAATAPEPTEGGAAPPASDVRSDGTAADPEVDGTEPQHPLGGPRREIPGRWHLDALDPTSEEVLQVTATFGGCEDLERHEVVEDADAVTIAVTLSEPDIRQEMMVCPAVASAERIVVVLDEPLGDRELRGCGDEPPDCLRLDREEHGIGSAVHGGEALVTGGYVVLKDHERLVGLDADDGSLRWRRELDDDAPQIDVDLVAVDDLVLFQAAGRRMLAVDRRTGHVRWDALTQRSYGDDLLVDTARGVIVGPQPGPLPEVDPGYRRTLGAVRIADGEQAWSLPLDDGPPLRQVVDGGDAVVLVAIDLDEATLPTGTNRSAAAVTELSARDADDGALRWTRRVAGGLRGAEVVDGVLVVQVWAARYGIDLATGEERWRDLPVPNAGIVRIGDELRVVEEGGSRGVARLDPATGATEPLDTPHGYGTLVSGDLLLVIDAQGVVTARDAADGGERWSTTMRSRVGPPGRDGDLLVFATPIGAVALDARDGSLRWSFADRDLEGVRSWG